MIDVNEFYTKKLQVLNSVFVPSAPIEVKDIFSGRNKQIQSCLDALFQKGRHVVLYGDRGIGKTSFANIIKLILLHDHCVVKLNCDSQDTFESLWKKVFNRIFVTYRQKQQPIGLSSKEHNVDERISLSSLVMENGELKLNFLENGLKLAPEKLIVIFDEFDRLGESFNQMQFVDQIKNISDNYSGITLVFVGVAENVNNLIGKHPSIERNLKQIHLPAMTYEELKNICITGLQKAEMKMEDDVIEQIVKFSCGFPHFVHLLCFNSCKSAVFEQKEEVDKRHLNLAVQQSVDETSESLREAYQKATLATKDNIFPQVLWACSRVPEDENGTFQANDLVGILSDILEKQIQIQGFSYHLGKLCSKERGNILVSVGPSNRKRYKFKVPLMKAFVKLKSFDKK
ncbi:MAG: AAA family ATPase [Oligoflexia bacterium]|nr:AAA family ATPase [Oligoflexia bacterium]